MKRLLLLICAVCLLTAGCGQAVTYNHISHDEAQEMLAAQADVILLDVRTPQEYEKKHLPDAVLLPIEDLRNGKLDALPDKNAKIIVYCWTGRRAEDAAALLTEKGYTNVYEMGGIVDWTGSVVGNGIE